MVTPQALIQRAKRALGPRLRLYNEHLSTADMRFLIATYTAAVAVNFTDIIGKTLPWVRSPEARFALEDNQRCEQSHDHVGMLRSFTKSCGVDVRDVHHHVVAEALADIRFLLRDIHFAGLNGLVILAVLENTSEMFIPRLEKMATVLGCTDLEYTELHGVADAEHSEAFVKALEVEMKMGYARCERHMEEASRAAVALIRAIFS